MFWSNIKKTYCAIEYSTILEVTKNVYTALYAKNG